MMKKFLLGSTIFAAAALLPNVAEAGAIVNAVIGVAAVVATGGFAIPGLSITASFIVNIVAAAALPFISQALAPKPKGVGGFQRTPITVKNRVLEVQEPTGTRVIVYGDQRVSGQRVFVESSNENKFLHIVVTLAGHELDGIDEVLLNDDPIHDDDMDGSGNVTAGKYANKVRIKKHLGTSGQTADSDLVGIGGWTSNHRLRGIAYLYVRFEFDRDLFPSSVPNISAWVRGKKVLEVRDSAQPTQFSTNPTLILRDYLITDPSDMGLGFDAANEIDDDFTDTAANICDQIVDTESIATTVSSVTVGDSVDAGYVSLNAINSEDLLPFQRGDRVDVTSTGSVPSGLGSNMYAIPYRRSVAYLSDDTVHEKVAMQFASTYDDAIAGNAVTITDAGSGTITVTKDGEPRYTLNGVVDSDRRPYEVIDDMLRTMGGRAVHVGGTWKIFAASYISPTESYNENDLIGPLKIQTRHGRRDRFNAVKGTYISPINNGVAADYPPITNSTYETEDNGIRIWTDYELGYVSRPHQAQRLAKIELERHRQQITVQAPFKLHAMRTQPPDVIQFSNDRMGWTDKEFEVIEWKFLSDEDDDGNPLFGITMTMRETASAIYDWNSGEETAVDPAPNTNLPNPLKVGAPTGLDIFTDQFTDELAGALHSRIVLTWSQPTDFFVSNDGKIEIQFKRSLSETWEPSFFVDGSDTRAYIPQVEDGKTYDIRIRAINHIGARSSFNTVSAYTVGTTFDPSVSRLDWRFIVESIGINNDWGAITDPVDSTATQYDWGDIA